MKLIILIDSPDKEGLIFHITSVISEFGLNIEKNDEFVDKNSNHFFMRTQIQDDTNYHIDCKDSITNYNEDSNIIETLKTNITKKMPKEANIKIFKQRKKKVIVFCTKEAHCLGDLLIKEYNNELDIDIQAIISNHEILKPLVDKFNKPFFYYSHELHDQEERILKCCKSFEVDFIILAKYMRILSSKFMAHFPNKIINIHHSFLPAFIGANPYKQAFERGVKIIGATAHFVNNELDCGPIIHQDIKPINHTHTWQDMQKIGKEIERSTLGYAIELMVEDKIFIHHNKTIIF